MTKLLRDADQQNRRNAAMMRNLYEVPAKRKLLSLLYISIGKTGRKMLMVKFPNINISLIELRKLVQNCTEYFQTRRNRMLDRHIFLSRKQKSTETLHQFWNALNGFAARCDFGEQTEGLVDDVFVLNMNNKRFQEKSCTKPKETPVEALQFVIAFEDGLKRKNSCGYFSQEPKVKDEPISVLSSSNQKES